MEKVSVRDLVNAFSKECACHVVYETAPTCAD